MTYFAAQISLPLHAQEADLFLRLTECRLVLGNVTIKSYNHIQSVFENVNKLYKLLYNGHQLEAI